MLTGEVAPELVRPRALSMSLAMSPAGVPSVPSWPGSSPDPSVPSTPSVPLAEMTQAPPTITQGAPLSARAAPSQRSR